MPHSLKRGCTLLKKTFSACFLPLLGLMITARLRGRTVAATQTQHVHVYLRVDKEVATERGGKREREREREREEREGSKGGGGGGGGGKRNLTAKFCVPICPLSGIFYRSIDHVLLDLMH